MTDYNEESALEKQLSLDAAAIEAARTNPSLTVDVEEPTSNNSQWENKETEEHTEAVDVLNQNIEDTKKEIEEAEPDEKVDLKRRLDSQFRQKRKMAEELNRLKHEVEVLRGERTETRDETIDREVASRLDARSAEKSFQNKTIEIGEKGAKEFADFDSTVIKLNEDLGGMGLGPLTQVITDAAPGAEHKILHYLGKNPTIAEDIMDQFNISITKGVLALNKVVDKATKAPSTVSKASPPIKRLATNTVAASNNEATETIDAYMARRDKEDQERYQMRGR